MDRCFARWLTPEEAGVSSKGLLAFLEAAAQDRQKVQFHSMVVLRHGKEVCRLNWAPYDDETPHTMFSLSKSFTSAAAGFAVSEGLIRWNTSVVDLLPEVIEPDRMEELRAVTLENLLCMGSGLDPDSDNVPRTADGCWSREVLRFRLTSAPMTHFDYNTLGTYLVSCMLQKVTGQTVRDYLVPRLFVPLGIGEPDWEQSPEGVSCGGFGLHISSDSIARFGQCLLNQGRWQGRQVLPEGWVALATRKHIENNQGTPQPDNEWAQGYGFQFWRCTDGRYRGDGMYGQVCMVDEARDAVVAVTCAADDMHRELALIRQYLFKAFDAEPADEETIRAFREKAAALAYTLPGDDGSARPLPEGQYTAGDTMLSLSAGEDGTILLSESILVTIRDWDGPYTIECPIGRLGKPTIVVCRGVPLRFTGAAGWKDGKLQISIRCPDGPGTWEGTLDWQDDEITFTGTGLEFPANGTVFRKK